MNELRQAAEQALEALEEHWEEHEAIDALRQALAKPEWVGLTVTAHDRYLERQRIAEEQHIKRTRTHETQS